MRIAKSSLLVLLAWSGCAVSDDVEGVDERTSDKCEQALSSGFAPAPTSAVVVNVREKGAAGDGSADDTSAINAAIAGLPSGATLFVPKGTYMINAVTKGVRLKSDMTLRMAEEAEFKAIPNNTGHYSILTAEAVTNVTIQGGRLVGDRSTHKGTASVPYTDVFTAAPPVFDQHEWGMGLSILGSSNVTVDGLTASECTGDGFYISDASGARINTDIKLCNVVADHNRRTGMSATQVSGMLVTDSVFSNTRGTPLQRGIDLEVNRASESIKDVTIRRSKFFGNGVGSICVYSGNGTNFSGLIFEENSFFDARATGVDIGSPRGGVGGSIIRNNSFKGTFWGINLRGSTTGTQIRGNTFCDVPGPIRNDGVGVPLNSSFEGNAASGNLLNSTACCPQHPSRSGRL
jgi:parallel beta-helix repeat protein